jgi:hypothetical protein
LDIKETGLLLAKISLIDNREASQQTILAWQEILADTDFQDALQALLQHHRESTEWIRPAHIVQGAKRMKQERKKRVFSIES